ncbi:glycosyltransferase family 2 protein [Polaribacter sargassicola]|uniref:glycosyltransferase family 2 protein n=1 Tax=Polaribacter sargassicola TaxID=2836891 RepID=UPI001F36E076|nr:glycosyltransferase family 2 protein [Polaribacter sp. DS7-9]MCG1036612.1 glycosyltransferase [Polaribacter sp. DS7-9]
MKFSLIICTYMRPTALLRLLKTVATQSLYPDEILIIDGSIDNATQEIIEKNKFKNLIYYKVEAAQRGLTKQRNLGVEKLRKDIDFVCFLDDDTLLSIDYFKNIQEVFISDANITGVGGIATNENNWKLNSSDYYNQKKYISIDGYHVKLGQRHVLRNYLGLGSNKPPGIMPEFSNGLSCGYPLIGKNYTVDLLIGMSMSFRRSVVDTIKFSTYFEGYGLYEDADFSLRALQFGKNVLATNVQLEHHHDAAGRPNKFKYGKMVTRNGWYVWRVKYAKPKLRARFKWNAIAIVLILLRFVNIFTTKKKLEAFTEALGRFYGLLSLIFNKPSVQR